MWEIDPADGLGAQLCGRCILSHEARIEAERKRRNKRHNQLYRRNKKKYLERMAKYRAESQRMRRAYRRRPEVRARNAALRQRPEARAKQAAYMKEYRRRKKNETVD